LKKNVTSVKNAFEANALHYMLNKMTDSNHDFILVARKAFQEIITMDIFLLES